MKIVTTFLLGSVIMSWSLIFKKRGQPECKIFGTAKRFNALNGRQLALTVNGTLINTTSSYKYLGVNLDSSLNL